MPFCPNCGTEYVPGVTTCADCQVLLVDHLPPDPNQGELFETVELCKVPDEITAMALKSFLLDGGVDVGIRNMTASFYGNVLNGVQGNWGAVIVDKAQEEKARKLYADFLREFHGQ